MYNAYIQRLHCEQCGCTVKNGRINNVGAEVPGSKLARVLLELLLHGANWRGSENGICKKHTRSASGQFRVRVRVGRVLEPPVRLLVFLLRLRPVKRLLFVYRFPMEAVYITSQLTVEILL